MSPRSGACGETDERVREREQVDGGGDLVLEGGGHSEIQMRGVRS